MQQVSKKIAFGHDSGVAVLHLCSRNSRIVCQLAELEDRVLRLLKDSQGNILDDQELVIPFHRAPQLTFSHTNSTLFHNETYVATSSQVSTLQESKATSSAVLMRVKEVTPSHA